MADVKSVNDLLEIFLEKRKNERYQALIYGDKGTGKTKLLATARLPVFVDSFDPGGMLSLREEIKRGIVVADVRWESEDPKNPTVFQEWQEVFKERVKNGWFEQFATYSIDSLTTFSQCIMNYVLKKRGKPGGIPSTGAGADNDYVLQMNLLENALALIFNLPCDVIVTAHPEAEKDELIGKIFIGPMITGKAKVRIPLLFSELYYAKAEHTKDGVVYSLQTRPSALIKASTRLGSYGKFEIFEKPDIKALLKKAGLPYDDKPIPWLKS